MIVARVPKLPSEVFTISCLCRYMPFENYLDNESRSSMNIQRGQLLTFGSCGWFHCYLHVMLSSIVPKLKQQLLITF